MLLKHRSFLLIAVVLGAVGLSLLRCTAFSAWAQDSRMSTQEPGKLTTNGTGRLYVFRMVKSFGAHLDGDVAVNGAPVQRVSPGSGFYCDVTPGSYTIDVLDHKTKPLKVLVKAGQHQYLCVMLHHVIAGSPRSGGLTSDQVFEIRLLDPEYGARRIVEYHLSQVKCVP
jgi:hypothetical protein